MTVTARARRWTPRVVLAAAVYVAILLSVVFGGFWLHDLLVAVPVLRGSPTLHAIFVGGTTGAVCLLAGVVAVVFWRAACSRFLSAEELGTLVSEMRAFDRE